MGSKKKAKAKLSKAPLLQVKFPEPTEQLAEQLRLNNVHLSKLADELACATAAYEGVSTSLRRLQDTVQLFVDHANDIPAATAAHVMRLQQRIDELTAQVKANTERMLTPGVTVPDLNRCASTDKGHRCAQDTGHIGPHMVFYANGTSHIWPIIGGSRCDSEYNIGDGVSVRCEQNKSHGGNHMGGGRVWDRALPYL